MTVVVDLGKWKSEVVVIFDAFEAGEETAGLKLARN
jgi:hypothetical protein